jgi:hypothetical protein
MVAHTKQDASLAKPAMLVMGVLYNQTSAA